MSFPDRFHSPMAGAVSVVFLNAEGAKRLQPGPTCRRALNGYAMECPATQEAQEPIYQTWSTEGAMRKAAIHLGGDHRSKVESVHRAFSA